MLLSGMVVNTWNWVKQLQILHYALFLLGKIAPAPLEATRKVTATAGSWGVVQNRNPARQPELRAGAVMCTAGTPLAPHIN